MSSMSGPHDWVISGYLDALGLEVSDNQALRKRQVLGMALANEIDPLGEGDAFLIHDGDDNLIGIAIVGPTIGLAIVSLEGGQKGVSVSSFGRLRNPVIVKTSGLDDGDFETPYRLTVHHASLPTERIVHQARDRAALDRANEAFGHLSDAAG